MESKSSFIKMNEIDDSGFVSQNTFENSSQFGNCSGFTSSYTENLPNTFTENNTSLSHDQKYSFNTPIKSNISLNESLITQNFQNFVLNSTPNFYVERPEFESKSIIDSTPNKSLTKFDSFVMNSNHKLGSPELNEILYPEIKRFEPYKIRTPQKFLKKNKGYSPAKKRLFDCKSDKIDPVTYFVNREKNFSNILTKIMLFLSEADLYSFKMVSRKWYDVLMNDKINSIRYYNYIIKQQLNKENCYNNNTYKFKSCDDENAKSTPVSPRKRKFKDFLEVAKCLKDGQTLIKCQKCQHAAVVENNISQCQRSLCGYISCLNCNSFSLTGPENFVDNCKSSYLVFDKPKVVRRLTDSPPNKIDPDELPFFLKENNNNNNKLSDDKLDNNDSREEMIQYSRRKSICNNSPLQQCNRDLFNVTQNSQRRASLATVVPCLEKKSQKLIEPPSPPKIVNVACSKQSKRRLKRLIMK